jgi:hypothetical protein
MWMRRLGLCFACFAFVVGVSPHVAGGGDSGKTKSAAKSKGREYYVQLTLYETDKNGHRKVLGHATISTPDGQEFNYLAGGEFPFVVEREVEWAQYGVSAHGKLHRLPGGRLNVDASIEVRQKQIDPADTSAATIVGQSVRTSRNVELGQLVHVALNGETTRFLDLQISQLSALQTANESETNEGRTESPAR